MPLLIESGLLKQSLRCQAKEHYEHTHGNAFHIHFVCEKCGKIIEEESLEIESSIMMLSMNNNFTVKDTVVTVKGLCEKCLLEE